MHRMWRLAIWVGPEAEDLGPVQPYSITTWSKMFAMFHGHSQMPTLSLSLSMFFADCQCPGDQALWACQYEAKIGILSGLFKTLRLGAAPFGAR